MITRSPLVRRSGLADRRQASSEELHYAAICREAIFAKFRGIQPGHANIESLILFDDLRHGVEGLGRPTLALPVSKFSLENVRARLAENEAKWAQKKE